MDYDDALSGDFDAHALEISPGPQSSALSLAKETVRAEPTQRMTHLTYAVRER
jgi:hypothetical protein